MPAANGDTDGTGFLLTDDGLIATCAHVVESAGAGSGDIVRLIFHHTGDEATALIEPEWWREPSQEDVAILRLNGDLPKSVEPLPLGSSAGVEGHGFETYGFPDAGDIEGLWGYGALGGKTTIAGQTVLQLTGATEVTGGFSGGPVWNKKTKRVVGGGHCQR